ncbi:uncharacterized protein LOC135473732 [Liolophura sinensis]|uniref:uncharacterized protein LOC135473732 n=1 Tax=Liolophura sinensis TaxID=3198878 RepID=UPI00315828DF
MADYLSLGFGKADFYNVSVSLKVIQCAELNISSSIPDSEADDEMPLFSSWDLALSQFLEPWSSDIAEPFKAIPEQDDIPLLNCNETLDRMFQFSVYPLVVLDWFLVFLLALIMLPAVYFSIRAGVSYLKSQKMKKSAGKQTSKVAPMTKSDVDCPAPGPVTCTGDILDFDQTTAVKLPPGVNRDLPSDRKGCQIDKGDVGRFLSQTLDLLNTGLNRVLWKTSSMAGSGSVVASPMLSRRWSSNLGSRSSSTTASLGLRRTGQSATNLSSMAAEEPMSLDGWDDFEECFVRSGWRQSRIPRISRSRVGGESLQQLTSFLEGSLSTDGGHWRASCMVVTYLLRLVDTELQKLSNATSFGLKFINFRPVGSSVKGTKTGSPNTFDILMVLQPTCSSLQEAIVGEKLDGLASGKTVLVLADMALGISKRFVKEVRLQESKKNCMLTRQTCFTAHGLLDSAMAEVAAKSRKLSERLPYRIVKIESKPTFSRLLLDTKPIKNIGFDVEEICINIFPAVCIADGGLQRLPLYAVPDWDYRGGGSSRSLSVPKRNNGIESEFQWSFCTTAFEEAYLSAIEQRMKLSAVDSCHLTCLHLMKTILQITDSNVDDSSSNANISGYWLETVINFLLLESSPEMWGFDRLTSRLSDAIIFFRRAVQNQRLPHFFISNPHLLKQFPYLKMFPWLSGDKQVNLMSSLTEANSEMILKQIEEQMLKLPLRHMLSQNYSAEMWEYEFFCF